jgi:NTP pyrophosphatase (non-canonical NTP hydrolase)
MSGGWIDETHEFATERLNEFVPGLTQGAATGNEDGTLKGQHARYLAEREHTVNQTTPLGQAEYVLGEASELVTAAEEGVLTEIRNELADVVLACVTLADMLGVTVENCIAEKTIKDRGRG